MESITKRPWGEFEILGRFFFDRSEKKNEIVIKKISVNPDSRLSLQSHTQRSEQWSVVSGKGEVVIGDSHFPVKAGDCAYVPQDERHRLVNNSNNEPLVIIEVGNGHFDENDIVRYEDIYGRA